MNTSLRNCALSLVLLAFHTIAPAQLYRKAFNRISTDDGTGLASNFITSVHQDQKGFLWVGTANGLQRFDGHKFIRFKLDKPGSDPLPMTAITQILEGDSGSIWLASASNKEFGIFEPSSMSYRKVPVVTQKSLPPRSEFRLFRDSKGEIFLFINFYGRVLHYDREKGVLDENTPLNNLPAGWKQTKIGFEDSRTGRFWLLADSGLCVYDSRSGEMWWRNYNPQRLALLNNEVLQNKVSNFYIDSKRRHWIINWPGKQTLYCVDSAGNDLPYSEGIAETARTYNEMAHIQETSQGDLWIYGLANLFLLPKDSSRFQFYRDQYTDNFSIRYENVFQLTEDRDKVLWFATDQGLYYNSSSSGQVVNMYLSSEPGHYDITDILQLQSGEYLLSTWGRGVFIRNRQLLPVSSLLDAQKFPAHFTTVEKDAYQQVWAMCQQKKTGKVFMGCQAGYLMIYEPATGTTEFLRPLEFDNKTIRYVAEDKQGRIWFGTQGGRVIRYDKEGFRVMLQLEVTAIIYKVFADREGWIWVATQDRGVFAIDPNTGQLLQHYSEGEAPAGIFAATCMDIEQLNDSLIYIASDALNIINKRTSTVTQITSNNGLPSNTIKRIRLDASGYLWIITSNGLCRYDHKQHRFTSYGKKDGILLSNLTINADYIGQDNQVIFAGTNALMYFNPEGFYNNPPPPQVTITDFRLGDQYLWMDSLQSLREVILQPDQKDFTISFACLDFRNLEKFTYYYQLEGLSKEWLKADNLEVMFNGLAPGRYTFRVKARNLEGLDSKISELRVYVRPPFWRTGWFASTLLMLLALVGYVMHRLRVNRLLAVEKIRNRVARDLHDDMGSTLSTISILSAMAKSKLHTDNLKAGEYLNKISDNSQRMMEAMDDIVWAIKPANDSMQKLVARLREFATNVFEAREIDLEFLASESVNDVKLDMEARRDFFLIGKEAINNAAKYARCEKVWITLEVIHHELRLSVKDNGIGFDVESADGGNGLGNMQRRTSALRGRLKIQSAPGAGSEIKLSIPLP